MASRAYVGQLYRKLRRNKELPKGGRLPPVLPMVTDSPPWTAATELPVAPPGSVPEAYRPRQRFFLIHRLNAKDLPRRNLLSLRARFAQREWTMVGEDLQALVPETDASLLFKEPLRHEVMQSKDVEPEARFRELAKEGDLKKNGIFSALFESRQQGLEQGRGSSWNDNGRCCCVWRLGSSVPERLRASKPC